MQKGILGSAKIYMEVTQKDKNHNTNTVVLVRTKIASTPVGRNNEICAPNFGHTISF